MEKYALFEQGLKDLYEVAKLLRTNSCYINSQNNTETSTTQPPSSEAFSGNVVSLKINLICLLFQSIYIYIYIWIGISCNE